MSELIENPLYNPMIKVDRIISTADELKRLLVEKETQEILQKELLKKNTKRISKKYTLTVHMLEDETNLNDSLLEEIKQLKNRLKILIENRKEMKEKLNKITEENGRLKKYKYKKHAQLKKWLKNRLKKANK